MPHTERREVLRPSETEGVMFLLYHRGRFLVEEITRPDSDFFGHPRIPAGKIEKGETPEEAMRREVKEELGVDVKSFVFLDTFEDVTLNKHYYVFHAFLVTDYEGEVKGKEPEKCSIYWLSQPEAWDSLKLASSRYVLCQAEKVIT